MAVHLPKHPISVDEYYRMAEAGVLEEDARVELLDGEIVEMTPIGRLHASTVSRVQHLFARQLQDSAIVWVQNPLRIGVFAEPVPDIALLKQRADFYSSGHPRPSDTLLVVEVADSSLRHDRKRKIPLYARAGILEVWLVDLPGEGTWIHRGPVGDGYESVRLATRGETITPLLLPQVSLGVDEILG